ncbi:transporter [Tenacibaculum maritimum]|uniref:Transporter n=1 Tax=Tenacibaculum maritimum NCIMB 2154 TaxID=1349785 RepID=A0A2H1EE99_9FLAO|nr:transporter [Tenacibaculum maritimum]MCD9563281.1 transporter [Tenacibaculum maritimum]MCD9566420.1 transporter [Tenacibaculum maritimum]MCD9579941.1 transporter [Tenacibaculum maritimum]MCD9584193.1 transporter [Tenacibaculum maritimum]MCD9597140.1 transporter [Tenacibaculum maritimum]
MKKSIVTVALLLMASVQSFAQENETSNIQTYTPSKLLSKGQWDIKWGNNLYTQTKEAGKDGKSTKVDRSNFFTSSLEVFTGVSESSRFNVGLLAEYRSNTVGGRGAFSVFSLEGAPTERKGLGSIAPAIKFQPFKKLSNFSVQSALHIPLVNKETENNVFLDQTTWIFQNRFFYDYTFEGNKWQLFTELNTEYGFGEDTSFANNTFLLVPSVFMSYFPNENITVLGFAQHAERFGDFTQDYTALGMGAKYQLTKELNIEALYSNFVRGNNNGLGESFNIGLRYLFTK